jgi:hypothetical protein
MVRRKLNKPVKIEIVPRSDGSFDLFERTPSGKLDFLSNHETKEEAIEERDSYKRPMGCGEVMAFFNDLKQSLKRPV